MKRAQRLRRSDQFQRVRRQGRTVAATLLSLTVAPSRQRGPRCGFVVGKRIGPAVVRNRARRRVREATRLVYHQIVPGHDLIFTVRSAEVASVPFGQLQAEVAGLLRRGGIWREPQPSAPAETSH